MLLREHMCSLLLLLLSTSVFASAGNGVREARMLRGRVHTTTGAGVHGARSMLSEPVPQGERAYLVGYEPAKKAEVAAKLKSVGGFLVAPVPDDHFLVRAQPAHIEAVLEAHPGTTAAVPPKEFRVEEALETLAKKVSAIKVGAESGEALGALLQGFTAHSTANGELKLELDVHGLPFAPMTVSLLDRSDPARQATDAAAAAWASSLQAGLARALSVSEGDACYPTLEKSGLHNSRIVTVCLGQLETALSWLTEQDSVFFVEAVHTAFVHNLQAASSMQIGARSSALGQGPNLPANMSETFPLWAAGLNGSNQVVGVGDTGIDLDSCFFWDENHQDYQDNDVKLKSLTANTESGLTMTFYDGNVGDPPHRKVRSYFFGTEESGNKVDDTGHGTHVAGTVAGAAYNENPMENPNLATGVAPGARVAFFDFQGAALADQSQSAVRPPKDSAAMLDLLYQQGVRIASNSWGSSLSEYTRSCQQVDGYTWQRDMLAIFAAGNSGFTLTPERGTVGNPAICKNSLAVGATDNWRARDLDDETLQNSNGDQKVIGADVFNGEGGLVFHVSTDLGKSVFYRSGFPPNSGYALTNWDSSNHIETVLQRDTEYEVVYADPQDACSGLSNDVSGKIVLFRDGNCGLGTKAGNVANTDAAAGILFATGGGTDNSPNDTPFATLDFDQTVSDFVESQAQVTAVTKIDKPHEHIMALSSYGPIGFQEDQNVQIKPEIAAPGVTVSASQSGTFSGSPDACDVDVLQGTSMAAPGVAGAASIVRQYFMDGYYPTGVKEEGSGSEPSASLVRAVLLAGAEPMTGIEERTGEKLSKRGTPNNSEGYGRLNLWRSLPTKGVNDDWAMVVFNGSPFNAEGTTQTFEVNTTSSGPLIVMLSWMDLPSQTGLRAILIQNLDLQVKDGSNTYYGNGVESGDQNNNNERVVIEEPGSKTYTIEVTARSLFLENGPQPFALVALGGVQRPGSNESISPVSDSPSLQQLSVSDKQDPAAAEERQLRISFPFEDAVRAETVRNDPSDFISAATIDLNGLEVLPEGASITFEEIAESRRRSLQQDSTLVGIFRLRVEPSKTSKTPEQVGQDVLNAVENGQTRSFLQLSAIGVQVTSMSGADITTSPSPTPAGDDDGASMTSFGAHIVAAVLLLAALLN